MKALLYSFLFFFSFNLLNCQIPFAPIGAKYRFKTECDQSGPWFWKREITRDTIIQGKYCTYVNVETGPSTGFSTICSKDDVFEHSDHIVFSSGYEVYLFEEKEEAFHLLYDFSKGAGESYRIKMCEELFNTDSADVEIKEVDILNFNGVSAVKQLLRVTADNDSTGYFNHFEVSVYEGIGGEWGNVLLVPDILTTIHCGTRLLCYWSPTTDEVIFGNAGSPCISVNTDDLKKEDYFKVYPNPSYEEVNFEYDFPSQLKDVKIFIYNSMGMLQLSLDLKGHHGKKEITDLPVGIYFITMTSEGRAVDSGKLIVTN